MPFGLFDPTMLMVLPALIFAMWAQFKVRSAYEKWSRVPAGTSMSGRDIAAAIMRRNGVSNVGIEAVGGVLSDHYDPRAKVVRLSQPIFAGNSVASLAVAAHEVGHVLQDAQGDVMLRTRSAIAPVASLGSMAAFPLFMIGMLFGAGREWGALFMNLGILFFAGAVVFHAVTLPVEFDASKRALRQLTETGLVAPGDVAGAKQVLDAAALTYVAAAATAALQLIRLVAMRNMSTRDD